MDVTGRVEESASLTGASVNALCFMRTTVDLPDALFRRAKACAAARGQSLKTFLRLALEREVGAGTSEHARVDVPLIRSRSRRTIRLTNEDIERIVADEDRLKHLEPHRHARRRRASA